MNEKRPTVFEIPYVRPREDGPPYKDVCDRTVTCGCAECEERRRVAYGPGAGLPPLEVDEKTRAVPCPKCEGAGGRWSVIWKECSECDGLGYVERGGA
jgi:hypothetical protein